MRIVAGEWRGRRIKAPDDDRVRPTADRVREAWMSILGQEVVGAKVLDLFAGSGALGLEALSRGAAVAEFVELSPRSLRALRENAAALGAGANAIVHRADAVRFAAGLKAGEFDIAFADPPYKLGLAKAIAERWLEVPFAGVLSVEHWIRDEMPAGGEMRKYGDTAITFYRG
ncbi:MAG TPA: 16S rRNA (guanine(966)-N(2))-methyltransferase RsmD [Gemmatimonadaceae bacterium]|nr:16S rRNA (guanine(966)-N(2))-methyltransferase RsmD [Gemmatimonadaceae bacterium]